MAELDNNIPLNYLSGAYTQNLWKGSPVSSVLETYLDARKNQQAFDEIERKKTAFKNVANARKKVSDRYNEEIFNKAESEQIGTLNEQVLAKQAELDAIDKEIAYMEAEQARLINETPVAGAQPEADYSSPSTPQGAEYAIQGLPFSNLDRKDRSPNIPPSMILTTEMQ